MKHPSTINSLGEIANAATLRATLAKAEADRDKFMWQVRDTCTRAERAEFFLALLAECFGRRIAEVHTLLLPSPVEDDYGVARDATDQQKAARHDLIRSLFHQ